MNVPAVEDDIETTRFPAFTTTESAIEPEAMVRVTPAEVRGIGVFAVKLTGEAAAALYTAIPKKARHSATAIQEMVFRIVFCMVLGA